MTYTQIQDAVVKYIPHDKCLHFIVGFFLVVGFMHFMTDLRSVIAVYLIAFIKELRDYYKHKEFDFVDVIATVLPAIVIIVNNKFH